MANSNATASASSNGIGFTGLLTLLLIAGKIWGGLNISWFLCFLPVIISFSIAMIVLTIIFIVFVLKD